MVRFYCSERQSAKQIFGEHQFVLQLIEDEVLVAAPPFFNDSTLHQHREFYFAAFPSLGSRQFETDSLGQMERVGHYLGCLHQTGRKQRFTARPEISAQEYLLEPYQMFEQATLIPPGLRADFLKATDKLIVIVMEQWHGRGNTLRLYGDCHAGNILWRDGPLFVDLDDARTGPATQDLWMLLNGDKAEQRIQLETIIKTYEELSPSSNDEIVPTESLCAM